MPVWSSDKKNKIKDEIYPNSELIQVSTGVTFDGLTVIECKRDLFQDSINADYPRLFVPQVKPGDIPGLLPYSFMDIEDSTGVKIAVNSFSFYTEDYPGSQDFISESTRLFNVVRQLYGITKLNNFFWRYVDLIPFTRLTENLPLANFLKLGIIIPGLENINSELLNINGEFEIRQKTGSLKIKIQNRTTDEDEKKEAFLLVTEFEKHAPLLAAEFSEYLNEGHKICRSFFEEIITDTYRQYLRGDNL